MAILNFDGENFIKYSVWSVAMGFPIGGVAVVGMAALFHLFAALKRFDSWGPVGKIMLGFLAFAGAHVIAGLIYFWVASKQPVSFGMTETPVGTLLGLWFVLYVVGMFVFYWVEKVAEDERLRK
jgi:hypothetical protein